MGCWYFIGLLNKAHILKLLVLICWTGIVTKEELELYDTLGEGEFGFVYRGSLRQSNGNSVVYFLF
jgi:hypothetical protein